MAKKTAAAETAAKKPTAQEFVAEGKRRMAAAFEVLDYPDVPKYRIDAAVDVLLNYFAETIAELEPADANASDAAVA